MTNENHDTSRTKAWFKLHFNQLWLSVVKDAEKSEMTEAPHKALCEILLLFPQIGLEPQRLFDDVDPLQIRCVVDFYQMQFYMAPSAFRMLSPTLHELLKLDGVYDPAWKDFYNGLFKAYAKHVCIENLETQPMRFADAVFSRSHFCNAPFVLPQGIQSAIVEILERRVLISAMTSQYAYTITHNIFYLSEFGRTPLANRGVDCRRLRETLEMLMMNAEQEDDRDVLCELLVSWIYANGEMDKDFVRRLQLIRSSLNLDGSLSRNGAVLQKAEFFEVYHTTLVYLWMESLCCVPKVSKQIPPPQYEQTGLENLFMAAVPEYQSEIETVVCAQLLAVPDFKQVAQYILNSEFENIPLQDIGQEDPNLLSVQITAFKLVFLLARHYSMKGESMTQIDILKYLRWIDTMAMPTSLKIAV